MRAAAWLLLVLTGCVGYRNRPDVPDPATFPAVAAPVEFSYADFQALARERPFVSKEELLQLFHQLRLRHGSPDLVWRRPVIERVAREIHTYFPLSACQEIRLSGRFLRLVFFEDQTAAVPGTLGQASLSLTRDLLFAVRGDARSTVFEVVSGGVRLNTSWLLKRTSSHAQDIQGTSLSYELDPAGRSSAIGIEEHRHHPRERLEIRRGDGRVEVDCLHPDLPAREDLRFRQDEVRFLGFELRVVEGDVVEVAGSKPAKNPEMAARLRQTTALVLKDPEAVFKDGLTLTVRARYDLERRVLEFYKAWKPGR